MNTYINNERQIAIIWDLDDVLSIREDLTDEQAMQVLQEAKKNHDANVGISWDMLDYWADQLFPEDTIS